MQGKITVKKKRRQETGKGARLELKVNFKNYEETYIMNRVRTTRF